jgi:putative addiction module killer protein
MFTVSHTVEFDTWLDRLRDHEARGRIAGRLRAAREGHFGDHASVGDGVLEMRLHFGPGYRLYFTRREARLIVMLGGGDKSSQSRDIARAKLLARRLGD